MNTRHHSLTLFLVLCFALSGVSCSDKETEVIAESDGGAQESTPAADSITEEDALTDAVDEEEYFEEEELVPTSDLASAYHDECDGGKDKSLDCQVLRSLLVTDVVMALEDIERSQDKRGTAQALAALDLTWEPEILIAACRVLGHFPDTPGIAEKAVPLMLDSPYLAVEHIAAQLLSQNPDSGIAGMGSQWNANHAALGTDDAYAPAPDFPEGYFDMGFPEYPDAEWYSPADSDRSVGWWVKASPAEVSARLAEELGVEALSYNQWTEQSNARLMATFQDAANQPENQKFQQLMEKYMKTQDPAVAEEMQTLQTEMEAKARIVEDAQQKSVDNLTNLPLGVVFEEVYYLVAEEKDGHISRLVMVYQPTGSERTVMQMIWNLQDYPPAWPVAN